MSLEIRPERASDFPAVRRVVAAAFGSDTEADLVERIRASDEYRPELSFVAADSGEVVGHVMIDGCVVRGEGGEREIAMLSPLAVAPHRQRSGVGTALIEHALAAADRAGEPLVVLEGSPDYYGARGFEFAGDHGLSLPLPDWAPRAAAQVALLSTYDPDDVTLRGRVVYPPSFDGLG